MLEGVNPNARHPGKGLERATFHHGVELSYCLVTVRVTVLLRFDAQLIPVAKNLTLLFFVIIIVFTMSMKDMALTGEVPYKMNPQSHQVSLFLRGLGIHLNRFCSIIFKDL